MRLGSFAWVGPRAAAAALRAHPLAGHPRALEDETLRDVLAVRANDCVDRHKVTPGERVAGRLRQAPPPMSIAKRRCLAVTARGQALSLRPKRGASLGRCISGGELGRSRW